jgi:hypothetical protein
MTTTFVSLQSQLRDLPLDVVNGVTSRARLAFRESPDAFFVHDDRDPGDPRMPDVAPALRITTFEEAHRLRYQALEAVRMLDAMLLAARQEREAGQ